MDVASISVAAAASLSLPLLLTLIVALVNYFQPGDYTDLPIDTVYLASTYDYIIIGSGSAGNIVLDFIFKLCLCDLVKFFTVIFLKKRSDKSLILIAGVNALSFYIIFLTNFSEIGVYLLG